MEGQRCLCRFSSSSELLKNWVLKMWADVLTEMLQEQSRWRTMWAQDSWRNRSKRGRINVRLCVRVCTYEGVYLEERKGVRWEGPGNQLLDLWLSQLARGSLLTPFRKSYTVKQSLVCSKYKSLREFWQKQRVRGNPDECFSLIINEVIIYVNSTVSARPTS